MTTGFRAFGQEVSASRSRAFRVPLPSGLATSMATDRAERRLVRSSAGCWPANFDFEGDNTLSENAGTMCFIGKGEKWVCSRFVL
jgi:hypothetical protein